MLYYIRDNEGNLEGFTLFIIEGRNYDKTIICVVY